MAKPIPTSFYQGQAIQPRKRRFDIFAVFVLYQSGTLSVVTSTLFVWPLLGRILSQNALGGISFHLAVASILAPVLCLGSHLYLTNRIASRKDVGIAIEARAAVALTMTLYLISIITVLISFIVESPDALISVSLSCGLSAYLVTSGVMRGVNRPRAFALFVFTVQVLGLLGLGLATASTEELRSGVFLYVLIIGMPVFSQYSILKEHLVSVEPRSVMRALGKSASLIPHLVLAVALLMMMRVLVSVQLGDQAAANYTFASLIIGGSITVGASLDAHWSVRAQASKTTYSLARLLSRNQNKTQMLLLVVSAGLVLFLLFGLNLWLPIGYDSSGLKIAVICALPAASLQAIADGRAAVLMWMNRPGLVSVGTAMGTSVAIGLAFLLLPEFGWQVIGLVLTSGLSIRTLVTALSARRVCPESRVGSLNFFLLIIQAIFASILLATV